MIAFEISVNGRHIQTLTVGEIGMLSAHLMWRRAPLRDGAVDEEIHLMPTGMEGNTGDQLFWQESYLNVGDTVSIRIIERDQPGDEPFDRNTPDELDQVRRERGW